MMSLERNYFLKRLTGRVWPCNLGSRMERRGKSSLDNKVVSYEMCSYSTLAFDFLDGTVIAFFKVP